MASLQSDQVTRSVRLPRLPATGRVPLVGALIAVLLLGVMTVALIRVQADDHRELEKRFSERAKVTAAVTESLFSSSTSSSSQERTQALGGGRVTTAALDRQVKSGNSLFAVVLSSEGKVLGASSTATPEIIRSLGQGPAYVRAALKGGFGLSDVLTRAGRQAMDFAVAFPDRQGGRRVMVTGISPELINVFIGGYLARLPESDGADAYVVDDRGAVVASTRKDAALGRPLPDPELAARIRSGSGGEYDDHYATIAPVQKTPWNVVLNTRTDDLYSSIHGTKRILPWAILALFSLVALLSVGLLARVVRSTQALAAANDELEITNARLAANQRHLEERAGELARSNAELEQFASVASHDLQEPLRKVRAFGEQLEVKYADRLPEEGVDFIHRMRNASERMERLIHDLLRFSRVMTSAEPFEWVDLSDIARDVVGDLETRIRNEGGRVEIGDIGKVQADALQMRQLLQNLIANGLKFHREGVTPVVKVTAEHHAGQLVLRVSDNGIGFEDRYRERIFRVFERLHGRTEYEGTGIGLALCRRIVERHGGTISGEGTPGEGSTFTVVIPVEHAEAVAPAEPAAEPAPVGAAHE